jgi:hypothetical protein
VDALRRMDLEYPEVSKEQRAALEAGRKKLKK